MPWLLPSNNKMVTAENALTGGEHPVLEDPQPHVVLGTPITGPWEPGQAEAWLGLGCFWGAEKLLWNTPGVLATSVGYAGGFTRNPTYREVCTGRTGHAEVVHVVYDPQQLSLEQLLAVMLEAHDPTQGFRQGNDVGTQYRSVIYTTDEGQAQRARTVVQRYGAALGRAGYGQVTTEICPLASTPAGEYFLAEDYHQQYLEKNPQGYCPHHSTGVACEIPSGTEASEPLQHGHDEDTETPGSADVG